MKPTKQQLEAAWYNAGVDEPTPAAWLAAWLTQPFAVATMTHTIAPVRLATLLTESAKPQLHIEVCAAPDEGWIGSAATQGNHAIALVALPNKAEFIPGPGEPLLVSQALAAGHFLDLALIFELSGVIAPKRLDQWRAWSEPGDRWHNNALAGECRPLCTNGSEALVLFNSDRAACITRHENVVPLEEEGDETASAGPRSRSRKAPEPEFDTESFL